MCQTQKYLNLSEIEELVQSCMKQFGLTQRVDVELNHRFTRKMGQAVSSRLRNINKVRFSIPLFLRTTEEDRENTIIHEVAHIITFILYPKATPHGWEWQKVHRQLGKEPARCHNVDRTGLARKVSIIKCKCQCKTWDITQTLYTRRINKTGGIGRCPNCKTNVIKE